MSSKKQTEYNLIYPVITAEDYNHNYSIYSLWKNRDIEWSSEEETIKRYFKREVLSIIDKGFKICGVCTDKKLEVEYPCPNCYSYNLCDFHDEYKEFSFEDLKKSKKHTLLIIMNNLDYFDYKYIDGNLYVKIYKNWRERIETFIKNQNYSL